MEARTRTLEITVISGENLCIDGKPVRENAYVVVRGESLKCCTTKMAKLLQSDDQSSSSSFLLWNEKLLLEVPVHSSSITFEVQCKTSKDGGGGGGGVRNVGVSRIAVSDILGGTSSGSSVVPESCMQVLSYSLRDWDGRRNGVIHFSVRVKTPVEEDPSMPAPVKGMPVSCGGFEAEVMGFKVEDEKNSNGVVVIGIPVEF